MNTLSHQRSTSARAFVVDVVAALQLCVCVLVWTWLGGAEVVTVEEGVLRLVCG